jgi:branched-chain amino acid transport system ATP-binding protein
MSRPKVLLLDEPSLGLAPIIVRDLFITIRNIRERGTTILLVEQNANMALSVADRGYVLVNGEIVVEGTPAELLGNEEVRAAYLGGKERSDQ